MVEFIIWLLRLNSEVFGTVVLSVNFIFELLVGSIDAVFGKAIEFKFGQKWD